MLPMTASLEPIAEAAGLFLAPFLHESLAFVGGAFLIHNGHMSLALCLAILLAGVVASDLGIYGLGRLARTHKPIAALLPVTGKPAATLDRHLPWLIPLCRFVPGLLFTTFASCGLLGVSFRKFALLTVLTACVYTPVLLWAVLEFGGAVASPGQLWPWFAILAGLCGLMALIRWLVGRFVERRPSWQV